MEKIWDENLKRQLGYPCNFGYDYSDVYKYLKYNLNNVGDPFTGTNYSLNTMETEKEVLQFFADLWSVKKEHWGYVTFSGTEGNMEGLLIGRERFPDAI
jgi:histidine decarboxylase